MADLDKQLVHELAMQYVSRTFDFSKGTPEEFLAAYQNTRDKIEKVIDKQEDSSEDIDCNFEVHTY